MRPARLEVEELSPLLATLVWPGPDDPLVDGWMVGWRGVGVHKLMGEWSSKYWK